TAPDALRFWRETVTSLLAELVGEPAAASASTRVIEPVMGIFPGARTSPLTITLWLLYPSTSTRTCGFLMYPDASIVRIRSWSSTGVIPPAATLLIIG